MKKRTQINKKIVMITELTESKKIRIVGLDYNNFEDFRITVDYSEKAVRLIMDKLRQQGFDVTVIEYFYKTRFGQKKQN